MNYTYIILLLLIFTPMQANAEEYRERKIPDMSNMGMSQINMQKIQQMQTCMATVDQAQLKSIEQLQYKFDTEMTSLCGSGKRDEAQQKAMTFVKQIKNNSAIKAMQKCAEIAKDMMQDMPFMDFEKDMADEHVCESY